MNCIHHITVNMNTSTLFVYFLPVAICLNAVISSCISPQWLCCGEVVSCVVVGDQYSVALEGDNYTIYCLPHCRPSINNVLPLQ